MMGKQPPRAPSDGPVTVRLVDGGRLAIVATTDGVETAIVMSEFNAWRVFGLMAMVLEIPLSKAVGKAIQLGEELRAVIR